MKLQPTLSRIIDVDDSISVGSLHAYKTYDKNQIQSGIDEGERYLVIHACKDPAHRNRLGYTSFSAPKGDNYLYVYDETPNRKDLYLNLIDGRSKEYMPIEIFEFTIDKMGEAINEGYKILVYCNKGESRSPGIVLLYFILTNRDHILDNYFQFDDVISWFKKNYYPHIRLGMGMYERLEEVFLSVKGI